MGATSKVVHSHMGKYLRRSQPNTLVALIELRPAKHIVRSPLLRKLLIELIFSSGWPIFPWPKWRGNTKWFLGQHSPCIFYCVRKNSALRARAYLLDYCRLLLKFKQTNNIYKFVTDCTSVSNLTETRPQFMQLGKANSAMARLTNATRKLLALLKRPLNVW